MNLDCGPVSSHAMQFHQILKIKSQYRNETMNMWPCYKTHPNKRILQGRSSLQRSEKKVQGCTFCASKSDLFAW